MLRKTYEKSRAIGGGTGAIGGDEAGHFAGTADEKKDLVVEPAMTAKVTNDRRLERQRRVVGR